MREASSDAELVDGLLDRVGDQVTPHGGRAGLADTVDARDRLELDGRLQQGFAEEDVGGVDEGQAGGVGLGVEEQAVDRGVVAESLDGAAPA